MLIGRCLSEIDGMPAQTVAVARGLGIADRRTILEKLVDCQPGPRYEGVTLACPQCGEEFPLRITMDDLFRG